MNGGGCRESLAATVHPGEKMADTVRASTSQLIERFAVLFGYSSVKLKLLSKAMQKDLLEYRCLFISLGSLVFTLSSTENVPRS